MPRGVAADAERHGGELRERGVARQLSRARVGVAAEPVDEVGVAEQTPQLAGRGLVRVARHEHVRARERAKERERGGDGLGRRLEREEHDGHRREAARRDGGPARLRAAEAQRPHLARAVRQRPRPPRSCRRRGNRRRRRGRSRSARGSRYAQPLRTSSLSAAPCSASRSRTPPGTTPTRSGRRAPSRGKEARGGLALFTGRRYHIHVGWSGPPLPETALPLYANFPSVASAELPHLARCPAAWTIKPIMPRAARRHAVPTRVLALTLAIAPAAADFVALDPSEYRELFVEGWPGPYLNGSGAGEVNQSSFEWAVSNRRSSTRATRTSPRRTTSAFETYKSHLVPTDWADITHVVSEFEASVAWGGVYRHDQRGRGPPPARGALAARRGVHGRARALLDRLARSAAAPSAPRPRAAARRVRARRRPLRQRHARRGRQGAVQLVDPLGRARARARRATSRSAAISAAGR